MGAVEIVVRGSMSRRMLTSFSDLDASPAPEGTMLRGEVTDEAALHGILERCRDLRLELVSLRRLGTDDTPG